MNQSKARAKAGVKAEVESGPANEKCDFCGNEYEGAVTIEKEDLHLADCSVYQSLPTALIRSDGRQFVRLPNFPNFLVERTRYN